MDLIQSSFILFLSYFFTLKLAKFFKLNLKIISLAFIFKTIICILYIYISKNLDNDNYGYFITSIDEDYGFSGTTLIFSINRFFREYFYFNIFSMTFVFSFIGNIGALALASNIKTFTKNTRSRIRFLSELVIFFPTLNLWTTAIGKDAITFASINLVIYALININSRLIILLASSILFSLVRPFVGIVLFLSLVISITTKSNLSIFNKLFIGSITFAGLLWVNYFNEWLNIFDINFETLSTGIENFSIITSIGNNAIELSNMPIPLRIFSFMFRPLFFDANDFYTLLMSFENLIILLIFLNLVIKIFKCLITQTFNLSVLTIFLQIYLTISWTMYSLGMANLGTANRYKLMFLPALISLSLIFANNSKTTALNRYKNN
tara:strand:- start:117 stop:1253 length:1137 start_codon:yes stop_codon:yes gene_type:complete